MIDPWDLAADQDRTSVLLRSHGVLVWQRFADWTKDGRVAADSTRGGGKGDGRSDQDILDAIGDDQAASYLDELRRLTERIAADQHRLRILIGIATPDRPRTVASRDMLAAQAAADGWCVSCFRDGQHLRPISLRPSGEPYYRDRCRACGAWKAENGDDPPLEVLRAWHEGRRVKVKAS